MTLAVAVVVLSAAVMGGFAGAAEYELASTWAEPSRTRFCPVHAPFSISKVGSSVVFAPPRRGAFSLAEASASFPAGTAGLRLKVSASGSTVPSFWRFALHRLGGGGAKEKVRFIAPVEVPSGGVESTVFVPWASFLGQKMRVGGMDHCDHSLANPLCLFQPEEITHVSVLWARKSGIEEPSLTLHEVVATSSTEVPVPVLKKSAQCSCDVDCVRCEVVKWAPLVSKSCSSSTTSDMCLAVRRSLAERVAAGLGGGSPGSCTVAGAEDAVRWLGSAMDVTNCMVGRPSRPAGILGDVLEGVFRALPQATAPCHAGDAAHSSHSQDFAGPFVGWGITGHNDLAYTVSETADSCLEKCLAEPRCKSIDYGARDRAQGECWLSTKDRLSAPSAYSSIWEAYDYYELAGAKDTVTENAGTMAKASTTMAKYTGTFWQQDLVKSLTADLQSGSCCTNQESCMTKAITAGAPLYNGGDALGCFVVYHAVAQTFAECTAQSTTSLPNVQGLFHATVKTSEMDATPSHAAWRLRDAFDAYFDMLRFSDPASLQCKTRTLDTLSSTWTTPVISATKGTTPVISATSGTTSGSTISSSVVESNKTDVGPEVVGTSASGAMPSVGNSWLLVMWLPLSMIILSVGCDTPFHW